MTDVQIDADTEKVTLLKVAWIIDQATSNLEEEQAASGHPILASYIQISTDTLDELRATMFTMFGYQEPGRQC